MSAPEGNQYALGNNGGRPPIYDPNKEEDIKKVAELCEDYYEWIKGEGERTSEPPTVTGLALHLGFHSKSTLYEYADKVEFSNSIKRALMGIEKYHEIATSMGDKCTGNIFILKNFGWKDTQAFDHTTNGKEMPATTSIVFKKYEDE